MHPRKSIVEFVSRDVQKPVYFGDDIMLWRVFAETLSYLERLERSVAESRAVDEASHFVRWLSFSGLVKVFDEYPQPAPFLVDGKAIRNTSQRLLDACGTIYKGGARSFDPSESRVDEINAKLDILLSQSARNISPTEKETAEAGRPALHVVPVGASFQPVNSQQ